MTGQPHRPAAVVLALTFTLVPILEGCLRYSGDAPDEGDEQAVAPVSGSTAGSATPSVAEASSETAFGAAGSENAWVALFNGHDLTGWIPKIAGAETGEDPWRTFRVVDGLLTVDYGEYDGFQDRFGHLFYEAPFSAYVLRIEYRFVGDQIRDGEDWAFKNSGVMFHSQSPGSMLRDQDFPISLEAQFLGGNGRDARPTASLCTPGTHVEMDGALVERHCITADAPTFHGEEWVTVELLVRGNESIAHVVEGDTVLTYSNPVIGGGVVNGFDPAVKRDGEPITGGYIALQSESHPIQFRRVEILELQSGG